MGVVECILGEYIFAPLASIQPPCRRGKHRQDPLHADDLLRDNPRPSASIPPLPFCGQDQFKILQGEMKRMTGRLTCLELYIIQMTQNLVAFFHHMGFNPSFPLEPQMFITSSTKREVPLSSFFLFCSLFFSLGIMSNFGVREDLRQLARFTCEYFYIGLLLLVVFSLFMDNDEFVQSRCKCM